MSEKLTDRIEVIRHSCIRIDIGKIIYIDPLMINGTPHDADIILLTHPHFDHFSMMDIRKILKSSTVIVCPTMLTILCRLMTGKKVISVKPDQKLNMDGINIQTVAAYNIALTRPHKRFLNWVGYIIETDGGKRIYITGDADATPESKAVKCDILMLPVSGSNFTMTAEEAAELTNIVRPDTVIPIHYGALLGGRDAAERFSTKVDKDIKIDIRNTVYSNIMYRLYLISAVMIIVLIGIYAMLYLNIM